jgi:hypothetical protein
VWRYKNHPIAYEKFRVVTDEAIGQLEAISSEQTPVLLLNAGLASDPFINID